MKEEVQGFFYLRKESWEKFDNWEKGGKGSFYGGSYEGDELSYVALYDTKYVKRVLKMSGLDRKTKDLIKQALEKT